MEKEFEETALKAPSEIDGRTIMWTYESLDEDHELEQFFAGIPGFCSSKVVDNPQSSLSSLRSWTLARALIEFLERTWSSNLVSETIKMRRLVICVRAIDAAHLSKAAYQIFLDHRAALFRSVELRHSLISWGNNDDRKTSLFAQCIIACIIANVSQRNERWFSLTMRHLGISEHVLRSYLDHGDSMLLASLVHFTRQFVRNFFKVNWEEFPLSHIFRRLRPNFNVQNTIPRLQHDFCSLWNEIFRQEGDTNHPVLSFILREIRPIYVALHQGSTLYDRYQLCGISTHRIDSASDLNEVDDAGTTDTARAPITTSSALYHYDPVPSLIPPVTEYHAPPSPTSGLDHAIPHLVYERSRNGMLDHITPLASSFHPAPLENDRISDGTAADSIQGTTDPSAISSMVGTGLRSTSSHDTLSQPTRNVTMAAPPFVPDTVPSPIPLLTVSPDPAACHISADPTVNQSGGPPDDGLIPLFSSQIFTSFPLASRATTCFDSNATTDIEPPDAPGDTLDPDGRVLSQPLIQPFPDVTADSPRLEGHDPHILPLYFHAHGIPG